MAVREETRLQGVSGGADALPGTAAELRQVARSGLRMIHGRGGPGSATALETSVHALERGAVTGGDGSGRASGVGKPGGHCGPAGRPPRPLCGGARRVLPTLRVSVRMTWSAPSRDPRPKLVPCN